MPLTPDDPLPALDERLAALHRMGPAEFEPGEREQIRAQLDEFTWKPLLLGLRAAAV